MKWVGGVLGAIVVPIFVLGFLLDQPGLPRRAGYLGKGGSEVVCQRCRVQMAARFLDGRDGRPHPENDRKDGHLHVRRADRRVGIHFYL